MPRRRHLLRQARRAACLFAACLLAACVFATAFAPSVARAQATTRTGTPDRPNVVLIITDDMGWADLSSYGAKDIRTPNIDRLAREGVRFTDFYANGVLCTPTRAALISGRYQQRSALEFALGHASSADSARGLPVTGHSLPQLLRGGGYATALVGKWHLGYQPQFSPPAHGFDYFWGLKSGYHDYYRHNSLDGNADLWENDRPSSDSGYTTDLITTRAVRWIGEHASRPFFIDVAYNAPHWPYQAPDRPSVAHQNGRHLLPADSATGTRADYVAMVERVDRGVGEILAELERRGVARNTLVIFTNDNGGEWLADNGPFFGRKLTVWEGGIRVPAIMRWPGRIPAGRVTPQVGITMDITATVLDAAGVTAPAARADGRSLLPIVTGKAPVVERTLFWRTVTPVRNQRAVRSGNWKLVVDGTHSYVYDLASDPGERRDLARHRQDVARRLMLQLAGWERDVADTTGR